MDEMFLKELTNRKLQESLNKLNNRTNLKLIDRPSKILKFNHKNMFRKLDSNAYKNMYHNSKDSICIMKPILACSKSPKHYGNLNVRRKRNKNLTKSTDIPYDKVIEVPNHIKLPMDKGNVSNLKVDSLKPRSK